MDNRGFRQKFAPVKVGDELDVKIEALGGKGDGIAKKDGFVLFIPDTKEGDEVRVRVTRVLRNVGFAEVAGEAQSKPEEAQPQEEASEEAQTETEPTGDEQEGQSKQESASDEPKEEAQDSEDFGEESEEKKE